MIIQSRGVLLPYAYYYAASGSDPHARRHPRSRLVSLEPPWSLRQTLLGSSLPDLLSVAESLFNSLRVILGHFGSAFGAGTTPRYQTAPGPDPLALRFAARDWARGYCFP